jgi:hypothetical protein
LTAGSCLKESFAVLDSFFLYVAGPFSARLLGEPVFEKPAKLLLVGLGMYLRIVNDFGRVGQGGGEGGQPFCVFFEPEGNVSGGGGVVVGLHADNMRMADKGDGLDLAVGRGGQDIDMFRQRLEDRLTVPFKQRQRGR